MSRKEPQKTGRVLLLPIDSIEPSPYQARTAFDEPEIAALAVSILQNGLLQPVSVRRVGLRKYQLVAGERRLRACRLAKLEKIPAILADFNDSESAALGLLENLQRSQLDPFDTARGIKEVIRLWGCTQAEAARRLGLSQPALANKLRLLTLTPEQQDLCTANHLSERHARAVLRLPEGRRTAALEKIARDNLSVRQTDKLVESMLAAPKGPSPLPQDHSHGAGCAVFCEHPAACRGPDDPEGHRRHHQLRQEGRVLEYIVRIRWATTAGWRGARPLLRRHRCRRRRFPLPKRPP